MQTKQYGIVGNPITGYPDGVYLSRNEVGWVRALMYDFDTYEGFVGSVPNTTNIAMVLTGQTANFGNDFWSDGWRTNYVNVVTEICERWYKKVRLIEFANEWDFWDNEDKAEKAVELAVLGTNVCKRYGILGVLGSVASGDWVAQLDRACRHLDAVEQQMGYRAVHGVAFHPYVSYVQRDGDNGFVVPADGPSSGWGRLRDKVRTALDVAKRPVALTELGIKVSDAGGLSAQELWAHGCFEDELRVFTPDELLMATIFCWSDANGSPGESGDQGFGMIGEQGQLKPLFRSVTYQMKNAPVVDTPVARLLAESQVPQPDNGQPEPPDGENGEGGTPTPPDGNGGSGGQETPPQAGQVMTVDQLHQIRWQAIVSHAPYNPTFGFERHWRKLENAWWGSPLTENEYTLEDGRPVRVFANAVVAYNADDTMEVLHE